MAFSIPTIGLPILLLFAQLRILTELLLPSVHALLTVLSMHPQRVLTRTTAQNLTSRNDENSIPNSLGSYVPAGTALRNMPMSERYPFHSGNIEVIFLPADLCPCIRSECIRLLLVLGPMHAASTYMCQA